MSEKSIGMLSPWDNFKHMVYEFFAQDPDINVQSGDRNNKDNIYSFWIESQNSERLAALESIMKNDIEMGNIIVHIDFKYANGSAADFNFDPNFGETWKTALLGNPYFVKIVTQPFSPVSVHTYAIFSRDIISFYADNLADYCANSHVIAAEAFKEIAKELEVTCCTEAPAAPGPGGIN